MQESDILQISKQYACVLVLDTNQTYGKQGKKMLYKAISYVGEKQTFLVPYQIKYQFMKKQTDKYVIVQVAQNHFSKNRSSSALHSDDPPKSFPTIIETIGDVDNEIAYSNYMYYATCNKNGIYNFDLMALSKILFIQNTQEKIPPPLPTENIITIDNPGTLYRDDAISASREEAHTVHVKVYITNICQQLLSHISLESWSILRRRLSSVYLPKNRKDLLPKQILEKGDLKEGNMRPCVIIHFQTNSERIKISDATTTATAADAEFISITDIQCEYVYISKNYSYNNEEELNQSETYKLLKEITPISYCRNSKTVIAYWSIQTNAYFARKYSHYPFIFMNFPTSFHFPSSYSTENGSENSLNHSWITKSMTDGIHCKYYYYSEPIGERKYLQMSSPLRRFIDLYNQSVYMQNGIAVYTFTDIYKHIHNHPPKSEISRRDCDFISEKESFLLLKKSLPRFEESLKLQEELNQDIKNIRKLENTTKLVYMFHRELTNKNEKNNISSASPPNSIFRHGQVVHCEYMELKNIYKITVFIHQEQFFTFTKHEECLEIGHQVQCRFYLFPRSHHYRNHKLKCCIQRV